MKNNNKKQNIKNALKVLVLSAFMLSSVSYAGVWNDPFSSPPSSNIPAPVNTHVDPQLKSSALAVDALLTEDNSLFLAKTTIGTEAGLGGFQTAQEISDNRFALKNVLKPLANVFKAQRAVAALNRNEVSGNAFVEITASDDTIAFGETTDISFTVGHHDTNFDNHFDPGVSCLTAKSHHGGVADEDFLCFEVSSPQGANVTIRTDTIVPGIKSGHTPLGCYKNSIPTNLDWFGATTSLSGSQTVSPSSSTTYSAVCLGRSNNGIVYSFSTDTFTGVDKSRVRVTVGEPDEEPVLLVYGDTRITGNVVANLTDQTVSGEWPLCSRSGGGLVLCPAQAVITASPSTIFSGDIVTLEWFSNDPNIGSTCSIQEYVSSMGFSSSFDFIDGTDSTSVPRSGTNTYAPFFASSPTTFILSCSSVGGTAVASVDITVLDRGTGSQTFKTSGSFIVPVSLGVNSLKVAVWGAGGGGGGGGSVEDGGVAPWNGAGGGGGGGGAFVTQTFSVTDGDVFEVVVGRGGTAGIGGCEKCSGSNGGNGSTSSFGKSGVFIEATGGTGGSGGISSRRESGSNPFASNGLGGSFSGSTSGFNENGEDGSLGSHNNDGNELAYMAGGWGGKAGNVFYFNTALAGGPAVIDGDGVNGSRGAFPGGGAGGGSGGDFSPSGFSFPQFSDDAKFGGNGGNGGDGMVRVCWGTNTDCD